MISKNKYHVLNKQYSEFQLDYKKEESILSDDNKYKDTACEICIQRSSKSNLSTIDLFVAF